jgi:hypothetical protein
MSASILESIKKNLGIGPTDESFDPDIVVFINGVFATLNQLGIGPNEGFAIQDASATWVDYLGIDDNLNSVVTYMTLSVKLLFDPPQTSFHLASVERQIEQLGWRLNIKRELESWDDPDPDHPDVIDGGHA